MNQWRATRRLLIFAFTVLLASSMLAAPVRATTPSRDKCTCLIAQTPHPTGAQVTNATACLRREVGPWCDIYVGATEDVASDNFIIATITLRPNQTNFDRFSAMLGDILDRYLGSMVGQAAPAEIERASADIEGVKTSVRQFRSLIATCVSQFQSNERIEISEGVFSCSVGRESGWLRLTFEEGERRYSFLFASSLIR